MFKNLTTDRLILKCIDNDDKEIIYKQFTNDDINKYLFDAEPLNNLEEAKDIIDYYISPEPRSQHRWILVLKENNEKIGTCGFHCWNTNTGDIQMGYDLQPIHWNKGYMSEAIKEILNFAKSEMKIKNVYAHIYPENCASIKIAKKLDFIKTDKQYYEEFRGEKYLHDIYLLSL